MESSATAARRSNIELHQLQYLYLSKSYLQVIERGLALARVLKDKDIGTDETELIDIILRAALKVEPDQITKDVVQIAALWKIRVSCVPTGHRSRDIDSCYDCRPSQLQELHSRLRSSTSKSERLLVSPYHPQHSLGTRLTSDETDALEALMSAMKLRGRLGPYMTLLTNIFDRYSPGSASSRLIHSSLVTATRTSEPEQVSAMSDAVNSLEGLSDEAKETLLKVLTRDEEVEDETLRDVRSL